MSHRITNVLVPFLTLLTTLNKKGSLYIYDDFVGGFVFPSSV